MFTVTVNIDGNVYYIALINGDVEALQFIRSRHEYIYASSEIADLAVDAACNMVKEQNKFCGTNYDPRTMVIKNNIESDYEDAFIDEWAADAYAMTMDSYHDDADEQCFARN